MAEARFTQEWEVRFQKPLDEAFVELLLNMSRVLASVDDGWLRNIQYSSETQSMRVSTKDPYRFKRGNNLINLVGQDGQPSKMRSISDGTTPEVLVGQVKAGDLSTLEQMSASRQFDFVYALLAAALLEEKNE